MGRGRQKAKQQKIARKLKYLTTDTDYDELAKELSEQEPGMGSPDAQAQEELNAGLLVIIPLCLVEHKGICGYG